MKKCSRCGTEKPTSEYHKDRRNPDGLYGWCKECAKAKAREYRTANPDKVRESQKRSRTSKPRVYRNKQLLWTFGITLEQYEQMLADQGGVCAVCGKTETEIHPQSKRVRNLNVDHCHDTGHVRGLLCNSCNRGIGLLKDDPTILRRALNYLEK
jgi:hypothetical protein